MPLKKGYSAKTIGKNIGTEMKKHPNMSRAQAMAIAFAVAYKAAPSKLKYKFKKRSK